MSGAPNLQPLARRYPRARARARSHRGVLRALSAAARASRCAWPIRVASRRGSQAAARGGPAVRAAHRRVRRRHSSTTSRRSSSRRASRSREPVVQEASRRGLPVVGDIELFAREAQAPVAAVTGTNGKSTVTTLVSELASAAGRATLAGGNLGEPALDLLAQAVPGALRARACRASSSRPPGRCRTATATVLNVTPDHMDRYASVEDYAAAKARIFDGVRRRGRQRRRRPGARHAARRDNACCPFSLESPDADYTLAQRPEPTLVRRGEPLLPLSRLRLQGRHNAANAMAALAMCEALACPTRRCSQRSRISAACRTARSGSPTSTACTTSTTRRAPMSARPSRPSTG